MLDSVQATSRHFTSLKSRIQEAVETVANPVLRIGYAISVQSAVHDLQVSQPMDEAVLTALVASSEITPIAVTEYYEDDSPTPWASPVLDHGAFEDSYFQAHPVTETEHHQAAFNEPAVRVRTITHAKRSVYGMVLLRTHIIPLRPSGDQNTPEIEVSTQCELHPSAWLLSCGLKYGLQAEVRASHEALIASRGVTIEPFLLTGFHSPIFECAEEGNVWALQTVMDRGDGSIKDRDLDGWTPLHVGFSKFRIFLGGKKSIGTSV